MIEQLEDNLRLLETSRVANAGITSTISTAQLQKTLRKVPPVSAADRRAALEAYYTREAQNDARSVLYPAVLNLLETLKQSDEDFRRVIVKDPKLTEKERRLLAEITRKRMVRALQSFTALINSFKGA
jgi:hypothetical protein